MLRTIAILYILLAFCVPASAQTLKTTSLNLNTGGVIHDIAFIPQMNAYVVVGRFSSIGGQARKNLAYVNASTFAVMPQNPITSINGEIRSVVYYRIPMSAVGMVITPATNFLFLGGNFTQVNGAQRENLLTMQYTETTLPLGPATNFGVLPWNYMMNGTGNDGDYYPGRFSGINDMLMQNDTLIVTGGFIGINVTSTAEAGISESLMIAGLKVDRLAASRLSLIYTTGSVYFYETYTGMGIGFSGQHYYFGFAKLSGGSTHVFRVPRTLGAVFPQVFDLGISDPPQYRRWYTAFKAWDATRLGMMNNARGRLFARTSGSLSSETIYYLNGIDPVGYNPWIGYDFYNGDMLVFRELPAPISSFLQRYSETSNNGNTANFTTVSPQIAFLPATNNADFPSADSSNRVFIRENRLFLSAPELTSVGGQPRTGLAVFCLEPTNPLPFVSPDLQACEGDTITYQIPDVKYETGYRWTYSGSGVEYAINGGGFQPYTAPVYNTTAGASSIKLRFPVGATSGTLTVEPYSVCNSSTDYLFAKPRSLAIAVNPKPVLTLSGGSEFTCVTDTLNMVASSSIQTVNYAWFYPNPVNPAGTNDTLTIYGSGAPSTIYPIGNYYVTITEPTTGCFAKASVTVQENTMLPMINQDNLTSIPEAFTCVNAQMELNASVAGATVYWTAAADTTVQFPNPHTIFSPDPANYIAFAVSNTNGCIAQQAYTVEQDYATIAGDLPAYPGFPGELITDTINCNIPGVVLQCGVDPADPYASSGAAHWVLSGTTSLSVSTADSAGMHLQTKTFQFVTENTLNGCRDTNDVTIYFDLEKPFVAAYNGLSAINCSVDTVSLVHLQTGGQVSESWLDESGNPTGSNTLLSNGVGTFVYRVVDTINGCQNSDTVVVTQTSEMYLTGTSDTLVCKDDLFTVQVSPVNIDESVTYTWSTGSVSDFTFLTGGVDTLATVIATTPSGCTGYDTIRAVIPPAVELTTAAYMSCGSESGAIQVLSVSGGTGSYQYALDSGTFSTDLLFDSLSVGTYTIHVKDALGCLYSFSEELDENAGAPAMSFLVSTYSGLSDTLAIVNNTVYQGFDSTAWVFPSTVEVLYYSDSLVFIVIKDTGWVNITMIGYIDTCQYTFTKPIYSGEVSPGYDNTQNSLKIQSVVVYPNPSTGTFTVDIVFGTEQSYLILVTGDLGQPLQGMQVSGAGTNVTHSFTFPIGTAPGSYRIHIVGEYDARQSLIILN